MLRMWIIAGGALLITYLGLVADYCYRTTFGYPLFSSVVSYIVFGAPFVFALGRERALELQIPATAAERTAVPVLFCFIVAPVGLSLLWEIYESIGAAFGVPSDLLRILNKMYAKGEPELTGFLDSVNYRSFTYMLCGILGNITPMAFGLYAALIARRSPVMSTIAGLVIGMVALGVVCMIFGIVIAITELTKADLISMGDAPYEEGFKAGLSFVTTMIRLVLYGMATLGAVVFAISIPVFYNKIKRSQI